LSEGEKLGDTSNVGIGMSAVVNDHGVLENAVSCKIQWVLYFIYSEMWFYIFFGSFLKDNELYEGESNVSIGMSEVINGKNVIENAIS